MYRKLSLELLVPHPENANRMSRTNAKKLQHGIEQIGRYETITVRPHPTQDGKFEVLNGHAHRRTSHWRFPERDSSPNSSRYFARCCLGVIFFIVASSAGMSILVCTMLPSVLNARHNH